MVFSLTRGGELPSHPWSTFCSLFFFFMILLPGKSIALSFHDAFLNLTEWKWNIRVLRLDRLSDASTPEAKAVYLLLAIHFRVWHLCCWLRALTLGPISSKTLLLLLSSSSWKKVSRWEGNERRIFSLSFIPLSVCVYHKHLLEANYYVRTVKPSPFLSIASWLAKMHPPAATTTPAAGIRTASDFFSF